MNLCNYACTKVELWIESATNWRKRREWPVKIKEEEMGERGGYGHYSFADTKFPVIEIIVLPFICVFLSYNEANIERVIFVFLKVRQKCLLLAYK